MTTNKPNGRYALEAAGDDEPPTRPGTPMAKLTPPTGTVVDGPLTLGALRAELAAFRRAEAAERATFKAELLEAVKGALEDGRTHESASLHRRVEALEKAQAYRAELPTYTDGVEG